jgi:hypothetical protein
MAEESFDCGTSLLGLSPYAEIGLGYRYGTGTASPSTTTKIPTNRRIFTSPVLRHASLNTSFGSKAKNTIASFASSRATRITTIKGRWPVYYREFPAASWVFLLDGTKTASGLGTYSPQAATALEACGVGSALVTASRLTCAGVDDELPPSTYGFAKCEIVIGSRQ